MTHSIRHSQVASVESAAGELPGVSRLSLDRRADGVDCPVFVLTLDAMPCASPCARTAFEAPRRSPCFANPRRRFLAQTKRSPWSTVSDGNHQRWVCLSPVSTPPPADLLLSHRHQLCVQIRRVRRHNYTPVRQYVDSFGGCQC